MARRIIVLSGFATLLCAYFIFFRDRDDMIWVFGVSLVILAIAYTFQFQIDHLMIRGVAQRIPESMSEMLLHSAPRFMTLSIPHMLMVEDRMKRWVVKKDWINKNEQDAPEDVKYIMAWYAALLTMHQEAYQYDGLDRIVFYHHPFLSPHHADDVHIAEVETTDGTIIISVPHVIRGHMEKGIYNIALHTMAEAYAKKYLKSKINWPNDIWAQLEQISSIPKERIEAYLGLPITDPWPVAVHHQVTYRDAVIPEVQKELPQLLRSFDSAQ